MVFPGGAGMEFAGGAGMDFTDYYRCFCSITFACLKALDYRRFENRHLTSPEVSRLRVGRAEVLFPENPFSGR